MEQLKKCTKCKAFKSLDAFGKDKSRKDGLNVRCKECDRKKSQKYRDDNPDHFKEYYKANKKHRAITGRAWAKNNPDKIAAKNANRRAMKHALPYSTSSELWLDVIMEYDCKCAITGKDKFDLEHFIPLSWGHGGSLKNNIYPMDSTLNMSKSNKNPYKWMKQLKGKQRTAFEKVIHNLAKENGMTNAEFRKYVYWCEKNKRTLEEVLADNEKGLTSIDLWRMSNQ